MNPDTPEPGASPTNAGTRAPAEAAGRLRDDVSSAGAELREDAREAVHELRDDANKVADAAKDEINSAVSQARGVIADQKDLAANQVNAFADAFDKVAGELGDGQTASGYARDFAGGLHGLADTMKRNDVDSLLGMAEDYGRQRPGLFLAGAALAGFAASRFLLASSRRRPAPAHPASRTSY